MARYSVLQQGRTIEVNVRLAKDVVVNEGTTEIRNAIDGAQLVPDEHGLVSGSSR